MLRSALASLTPLTSTSTPTSTSTSVLRSLRGGGASPATPAMTLSRRAASSSYLLGNSSQNFASFDKLLRDGAGLPSRVRIVEVGPRDGLQNEKRPLPVDVKVEFIERLYAAGLREIEVGAFVSSHWVPQMAATDELYAQLPRHNDAVYSCLTPNRRGIERALASRVDEVAVFTAASESFSEKNTNCSIERGLARCAAITETARAHNTPVRGYISTVWGCPYEGEVSPDAVLRVVRALRALGVYEISLGDTIGSATPGSVARVLDLLRADGVPADELCVHFHNTYGMALPNLLTALAHGVAAIDSSVGGLGGCPYAPGASGNVATEDVVRMLDGLGIAHGLDLERLLDTGRWISAQLGRPSNSALALALEGSRRRAEERSYIESYEPHPDSPHASAAVEPQPAAVERERMCR